jgi:nitrogen fixation protein FixH
MKRGAWWPIGIATILGATVAGNVWLAVVAGSDPSFSIEPNYYQKAIAWDSTMAQARENQRLGWRLEPRLAAVAPNGESRLDVMLVDSAGAPIRDATVRVAAFFNARASHVVQATLAHDTTDYSARLPIAYAGEWELRFDVRRGREHFTNTRRIEAVTERKS